MKTVVITMENLSPGPPGAAAMIYPVSLFFDDGQPDWMTRPLATATIPQDLSVLNPPVNPVSKQPVDGAQIRNEFIKTDFVSPLFEVFGDYLYQLLFQGPVGLEWTKLRGQFPREGGQSEGLRVILDIKPDALRWLPWELLYKAPLPLFFDSANPFVRGTLEQKLPVRSFTWPIHVLIVVGSEANDPKVKAEEELNAIQYAFIKAPVPIDWEIRYRPTKAELTARIVKFKPQILHFVGHCRNLNGYSYLELSDAKGAPNPEEWTVQDISIDMLNWQPRLAFINACRTSSSDAQENSWDIARAFSNAGVPAVLGMQADIQGDAAAAFSGKFYEALVNYSALDRALAEARAAVKSLPTITVKRRDWALATLYLQQRPEEILEMQPEINKQKSAAFEKDPKLKETRDFVGRRTQRRKLWYGVDPTSDHDDDASNLLIVVGAAGIGKTALVQASMKICALRRRRVSYVDIGYQTTKDFVEVLKIIREGDPRINSIICEPLPTAPFAAFDQEYGPLLQQADAAKVLAANDSRREQFFTAYQEALVKIAAAEPLIIVLDNLSVEWELFKNILVKEFLLPIARNEYANCRMILVVSETELREHLPKELKDSARLIELTQWAPAKFIPLAQEICLYNDLKLDGADPFINATSTNLKSDWGPDVLRSLVRLLKTIQGVGK